MGLYSSGGGTTTTTSVQNNYDPVANARAMVILEREQAMSEDMWAKAQEIYAPYEKEMVELNRQLLPLAGDVSRATMEEQLRDLNANQEVKDALRTQQLKELEMSAPVAEKFYEMAGKEVDVNERMGEATSDITQAYKGAEGELRRTASRTGLKVTAKNIKDMALEKAKSIAFARTTGRKSAEDETFSRLQTGMQARGSATGLPGISTTQGSNQTQFGNYNLSDPSSTALQGMSSTAAGYSGLASRVLSSTNTSSTSNNSSSGFGSFLGNLVGIGVGAYTGGLGSGLATK